MTSLESLPVTQRFKWSDSSQWYRDNNGNIVIADSAGTGFGGGIKFQGGMRIRPFQTGSGDPSTVTHFPNEYDWGLYYNSVTGRLAVYCNIAGSIKKVALSDDYYNPLDYYQAADGDDHAPMIQRACDAMASPTQYKKRYRMSLPFGRYTLNSTVQLPQTTDADTSKARALFEFFGCNFLNGGFDGPLFARTAGTPTPNSLFYTIRGGYYSCGSVFSEANRASYWTDNLDLDASPMGGKPANTRQALQLSNCDQVLIDNIEVSSGTGVHLIGTKQFTIKESVLRGGPAVYLESDGNGRNCVAGIISHVRANTFGTFGVNWWLEEADAITVESRGISEQGRPRAVVAWVCNDRTDCKQLVVKDIWYENHASSETSTITGHSPRDGVVFVANKAANASLHIDGFQFFGSQNSLVRYAQADNANLVVTVEGVWAKWSAPPYTSTSFGESQSGFVVPELGPAAVRWDSATSYTEGMGVFHLMPVSTPTSQTPNMCYLAVADSLNHEPATQWHVNLSGGSSDYYPIGTRVYDKGYIYQSQVAEPSSRPTLQTTTTDWLYVGAAAWMPTGQLSVITSSANSHEDNAGGNPKQTGTGNISGFFYGLEDMPPLLEDSFPFFDNYSVPTAYRAEGSTSPAPQAREMWLVLNGVKVTT